MVDGSYRSLIDSMYHLFARSSPVLRLGGRDRARRTAAVVLKARTAVASRVGLSPRHAPSARCDRWELRSVPGRAS